MVEIVQYIIDLIIQPGSSLKLVPAINVSVVALLCVMVFLTYTKIATVHIVVMTVLALGLLASVNWVVYEVRKSKASEENSNSSSTTNYNSDNARRPAISAKQNKKSD